MSLDAIRAALLSRNFESLVGLDEDTWFEGKQKSAYDLESAAGRYELAKDVSAFANAEGGFLLVGVNTARRSELNTDTIVGLDLCASTDFDVTKFSGVIREYIHPQIENLRVDWMRSAPEASLGLGIIEVPSQDHDRKYFLTARVVEDGQTIRQIVFGLSTRNKSANDPLSIRELQET